jgi:hypothetical protein
MATMYGNLCGNCVNKVDISLTVRSRAIFNIVKSMCNGIKNQMHAYEMSYKCQRAQVNCAHGQNCSGVLNR